MGYCLLAIEGLIYLVHGVVNLLMFCKFYLLVFHLEFCNYPSLEKPAFAQCASSGLEMRVSPRLHQGIELLLCFGTQLPGQEHPPRSLLNRQNAPKGGWY